MLKIGLLIANFMERNEKGQFIKGGTFTHSGLTKKLISEKLRLAHARNNKWGGLFAKGHPDYVQPEARREAGKKISNVQRGRTYSLASKQKMSIAHKGKKMSLELRQKLSVRNSGSNHPNWKGGITPINGKIRRSLEYRMWRDAVFKRDEYTCQWCKKKGVYLNADHIKMFAMYPELRFEINNGRSLCEDCHNWKTKIDMMVFGGDNQYKKRQTIELNVI